MNLAGSQKVAEVVEASSADFIAMCYQLHGAPPLGSLVRTGDGANGAFGVVARVQTSSLDPGRRPIARGATMESERELFQAHPQLEKLLRTDLRAVLVGCREDSRLCRWLPASPPRLHSFVYLCSAEEAREFAEDLGFLRTLAQTGGEVPTEEVLAACLRGLAGCHEDGQAFLRRAASELARFYAADVERLNGVLRRLPR